MDSSNFENLRVRAWMQSPIVSDDWCPLDGALLYQFVREDLGYQEVTISGASLLEQPKGETMRGGRMPIAVVHGKYWYYRCSWAVFGPYMDGQDFWNKRFDASHADLIDFKGKRGKIDTSSSTYKAYRMPVFYRSALWIEWYLRCDADWLKSILPMITHLGKKTSQGWGKVLRWEINNLESDISVWKGKNLMRGIPLRDCPEDHFVNKVGLYGIRPPYWDKRNQMELVLP